MTGVGEAAFLIWEALVKHGNPVELMGLLLDPSVQHTLSTNGASIIKVPDSDYERHPGGEFWLNSSLPGIVKNSGASLFHGTGFRVPWLPTSFKKVVTIYDLIAFRMPDAYPASFRHYIRWVTHFSAKAAHRIIVPSENTRCDVVEFLKVDSEKIDIAPLYASPVYSPLEPDSEEKNPLPGLPEKFILCVGTLDRRKNQLALIRAFELLKDSGAPHQLYLVGHQGHGGEEVMKAIEKSRQTHEIIFVERLSREELRHLYSKADLFVFPSLYEGFGLPVLEAMSCGAPVLCSNAASLPEVGGDAAEYFDPNSPGELSEKMRRLLDNGVALNIMRKNGLDRAAEFTAERCARAHLECYRKALKY